MRAARILPILGWTSTYRRADLSGDLMAGAVTAIMIVPQAMAYALLAGLPPQVGLYASIAPLIAYAVFGTSRTLAVGPVAIISLLTAAALAQVAESGAAAYQSAALVLAGEVGIISVGLAVVRAGHLVNFISHPVISGFTSAAAIVIGFSNMKDILGVSVPRMEAFPDLLVALGGRLGDTNLATLAIGGGGIAFLLLLRGPLTRKAKRLKRGRLAVRTVLRAGPLLLVAVATLTVYAFGLDRSAGVEVVGHVPTGLPPLTLPAFDRALALALLPSAVMIALIGFLESVAVAKALAAKRRETVDANSELLGLGAANIAASFTGGFPVTGGFGRSNVNFDAGAVTQLSAMVSAVLVGVSVLVLPPLFGPLPPAALAAIIIVSVLQLIDVPAFRRAWAYNRADAVALFATFAGVLALGVETGILIGLGASLGLYMWRTAKPHYAVVGRVGDSEHFRNVKRHQVRTDPRILALRIDESLYFANARFLETTILSEVAARPRVQHVVLICSAVNVIDTSALESLETLIDELKDAGVTFHLAEVKGPVMDRLQRSDILARMAPGRVFLSTHDAVAVLQTDGPCHAGPEAARQNAAPDSFEIRPADPADLAALAAIERDAQQRYRTVGYDYCADGPVCDAGEYKHAFGEGVVLVAEVQGGPVGFLMAGPADGRAHIVEISVRRDHQGRGIGRALIAAVEDWAREAGYGELTLTTYRDVPWNAPFYRRLGFEQFEPGADRADLRAIQADEAAWGFARWPRCAMRKALA